MDDLAASGGAGDGGQSVGGSLDEALAGLMNLVTELRQRVDLLEQQNAVLDDEVAQLAHIVQPRQRKGGQP